MIYSCTTPLGIAVGLGIRETCVHSCKGSLREWRSKLTFLLSSRYNPDSTAASIVSGVLDATSAGILLWAGLVECLAHDFVFDRQSEFRSLSITSLLCGER